MTVHSIAKGLLQTEANMTPAADKQSSQALTTAEAAFASVLQQTAGRFGGTSLLPTAGAALKEHFDRPVAPPRPEPARKAERSDAKPADKPRADKPLREPVKADKPQAPAKADDRPAATRDDDDQAQPAAAKTDDTQPTARANDDDQGANDQAPQQAQAQDDGQAAQQTAQKADTQGAAAVAAAQNTNLGAAQAKDDQTAAAGDDDQSGAADDDTDPFAWLDKQHGKQIKALEAQITAGDDKSANDDALDAEFAAKMQAAIQAGAGKAKATGPAHAQMAQQTDQARSQADDLAQMLGATTPTATRIEIKVQVTETTTTVQVPTGNAVMEALAALEAAQQAATGQQVQDGPQTAQPQAGQASPTAQPAATAEANATAQAMAEQATAQAEDKPFAAALAAQLEASNQPAANTKGPDQPQAIAGLAGVSGPQAADKAAPAQAAQAARRPLPVPPQQIVEQVTVQIDKQVKDGADTVKINLKPVELGKIEIKLEVGPEGRVSATITADRPETLAVLQKDAKGLEKALGDAGLKADSQAMSFNLRGEQQQNADRGNNSDRRSGRSRGRAIGAVDDTRGLGGPAAAQPRLGGRSGVDISV